jgi:hypothetical protein
MRNLWDVTTPTGKGLATIPIRLKSSGIKRLMERALWGQEIRTKLEEGKKRHDFQVDHGYRKFFKTRCEIAGMKPINIEKLMGHSTGISDSYYRATEKELLDDYLKVIDFLTVNEEHKLSRQVVELTERNQNTEYMIKGKLQEKDEQIKLIQFQMQSILEIICNMKHGSSKNEIAKKLIERNIYQKENRKI